MPYDPDAHSYALHEIERLLHIASLDVERCRRTLGDEAVRHALSAAWRVADAGVMLRGMLEREDIGGVGVTTPTGRQALLPTRAGETTSDTPVGDERVG